MKVFFFLTTVASAYMSMMPILSSAAHWIPDVANIVLSGFFEHVCTS